MSEPTLGMLFDSDEMRQFPIIAILLKKDLAALVVTDEQVIAMGSMESALLIRLPLGLCIFPSSIVREFQGKYFSAALDAMLGLIQYESSDEQNGYENLLIKAHQLGLYILPDKDIGELVPSDSQPLRMEGAWGEAEDVWDRLFTEKFVSLTGLVLKAQNLSVDILIEGLRTIRQHQLMNPLQLSEIISFIEKDFGRAIRRSNQMAKKAAYEFGCQTSLRKLMSALIRLSKEGTEI